MRISKKVSSEPPLLSFNSKNLMNEIPKPKISADIEGKEKELLKWLDSKGITKIIEHPKSIEQEIEEIEEEISDYYKLKEELMNIGNNISSSINFSESRAIKLNALEQKKPRIRLLLNRIKELKMNQLRQNLE